MVPRYNTINTWGVHIYTPHAVSPGCLGLNLIAQAVVGRRGIL